MKNIFMWSSIILTMVMTFVTFVVVLPPAYSIENLALKNDAKTYQKSMTANDTVNLSNNGGHSENPKITIDGNKIYAAWVDDSSGRRDLYFSKSVDNGCNFQSVIDVSDQEGGSIDPQIAVSGNHIYLIWEHTPGNNGQVYFTRSTDRGNTFEKVKSMGNNTGFSGFPQVATSGKNVYLVWHDASHGILLAQSKDNGASFEKVKNIGNNTGFNSYPQVSVSGNDLYIAWINNEGKKYGQVFFTRSTDKGANFKPPIELSEKTDRENGRMVFNPRIAFDLKNHNVYLVWHSGRIVHQFTGNIDALISDVLFKRSTDNGASFDSAINLSNYSGWAVNPQIAVSQNSTAPQNNTVNVIWTNNAQQKYGQIFFTKSTDNGASFDSAINLSNYSGWAVNPQIAVSQNNTVNVIWTNNSTGNEEVLFKNDGLQKCASRVNDNMQIKNSTGDVSLTKNLNIAFVDPMFTFAAYDSSFYLFYSLKKPVPEPSNFTHFTSLLSSKIPKDPVPLRESDDIMRHLKWLLPKSNISFITDQDVHNGLIFDRKGSNQYNILILSHQEYVTQREYDNIKKFVSNGGILILLDGNVFYAEVNYDNTTDSITLIKGHNWAFNGQSAWKSVEERWANETTKWIGSNYLCCYDDKIVFKNNPFDADHDEEQYITNPNVKNLLDYNATENEPNPRNFTIATYELDHQRGKVLTLGLYTDDLKGNERFWRFFDSLIFQYVLGHDASWK